MFSVAGLPGPPFSDLDTVLVNFAGARHLIESLVPQMPEGSAAAGVSSNAGLGWEPVIADLLPIVQTPDFAAVKKFLEENPDRYQGNGYACSKQLVTHGSRGVPRVVAPARHPAQQLEPGPDPDRDDAAVRGRVR